MYRHDDTIVAISTPPGRGGIGVVRLSGPGAPGIAAALLGRKDTPQPRVATFGRIRGVEADPAGGEAIDQVVCTWFPAPSSYTGEDVVEISGHGNPVLLGRIVEQATLEGARPANPGEFTLRAFLHGKLDLVQAEAVADLIDAVTPLQTRVAFDQLEGTLTREIARVEGALFGLLARLEASLDFPEEGYQFVSPAEVAAGLSDAGRCLSALLATTRAGRLIREGRQVVISGRPNVGKSSLFNALLSAERAIVTDVPGTTRDLLTEVCDVNGVPVTLVDTAGLRASDGLVERAGIDRARRAAEVADLVVVAVDGSAPLDSADEELSSRAQATRPAVVAVTKADLPRAWSDRELRTNGARRVRVSAMTGEGMAALRSAIVDALGASEPRRDQPVVTNVRHARLLERAGAALGRAESTLSAGGGEELVAADLREALDALQEITGRRASDALLREIFGRFCIGK